MKKLLMTAAVVFNFSIFNLNVVAGYSGGDGSVVHPYQISSVTDWQTLMSTSADWKSKYFMLTADINLAGVTITPVGNSVTNFTSTFNGNGHIISNAVINLPGSNYVGLFGRIGDYIKTGEIKNLGLENAIITGGASSYCLGGLCGYNYGTISNCYVTGSVTGGASSQCLGGLCGYNYGIISNCYSTGSVTGGVSSYFLGGLCGHNFIGTISNCYATGLVTSGSFSWYLGGLCGWNYCFGTVSNCYFYLFGGPDNHLTTALEAGQMIEQGNFTGFDFAVNPDDGTGDYWAITAGRCPKLAWQTDDGPLPPSYIPATSLPGNGQADNPFQIRHTVDFAEFIINEKLNCGYYVLMCNIDLSGQSFATAVINRCFGGNLDGGNHSITNITIDTKGASTDYLGMFGIFCGSIRNLKIDNITITGGSASDYLGGLCGQNDHGTISNCYIAGSISSGASSLYLGGVCGGNYYGTIDHCYATGSASGNNNLGGLCGWNYYGTISNCYATGSVSGNKYFGGLCGENSSGTINNCCANGSIDGGTSSCYLGGLCGRNSSGVIGNCYATGSVSGDDYLGGLCGENFLSTISNCYAAGFVSGDDYLGGLCGKNDCGEYSSTISNCYSTGSVTGDQYKGGFCGINSGSIISCFWNTQTCGLTSSDGGTGKTIAEMKTLSTFTAGGWDFANETDNGINDFWRMCSDGVDYPRLTWSYTKIGDFICPDDVNIEDLDTFIPWWLSTGCTSADNFCNGVDMNVTGTVELADFAIFANHWLQEI